MGGGSKSSSSSSSSTTEKSLSTVDNRALQDVGYVGGNITLVAEDTKSPVSYNIETTDFGAIDAAGEVVETVIADTTDFVEKAVAGNQQSIQRALEKNAEVTKSAVEVAKSAAQDEAARTMQFAVIGVTIAIVAVAWRKELGKLFK
jgi:hypothetical protein